MAHKLWCIACLLVIDRGLFEKFEIISMVFGIAAGIWKPRHIECSDNREAAFAKRVSDWSLGSCPHKNSWRFLPEFRGRSCDARLFCNRRLIICCLLKQWFQKGHWWFRNDTKKKCEGAVQDIQKLSEVSQVRRLGKLADHRIQLKKITLWFVLCAQWWKAFRRLMHAWAKANRSGGKACTQFSSKKSLVRHRGAYEKRKGGNKKRSENRLH